MALQSEVSPPLVGDPNKDTKIDGDTKSEEENDSSQSTDEDVDLEEGEILDSGEEEEEEKKDFTNSSLKEALDKNFLKSIEQLVSQAKTEASPPNPVPKNMSPHNSPLKMKKRPSKYMDHDRFDSTSDQEDGWYTPSKKLKSKFDAKPIDYRMELEAYRGTPPSSPDRKHKDDKKKKRSSRKSKKSSKKSIKRKDAKGLRVQYRKETMRKKMCKFFKEGKCAKGGDCPYSHASPQSYKKKELCKFYLSGHCNKGSDCIYMHSEFPCKFYHTGSECYAKDDCRFSHAPLTEEMDRVLADYLKIPHGDDDYDRKRRSSPSPEPKAPPAKRTCLLGSPPRHIREAEETKRWQEEMLKQQQNHPGFKIHISPPRDGSPPPAQIPKPNFYQETLPSTPSPKKHRKNLVAANVPVSTSFPPPPSSTASGFPLPNANDPFPQESPERYIYDDDYQEMGEMSIKQEPPDFSWTNIRGIDHNLPPLKNEMEPFVEPAQQDLDFTNDVKFDETTQFSEMESLTDGNETSPPNSVSQTATNKESEEESSNQGNIKTEDKTADDSSSNQEPPSPIIIPSHLPKKQQELFKRIQQHQRKNAIAAVASDLSNSPKAFDTSEPQVREEPEEVKEKPETEKSDSLWYSSEDDDDDDTVEPLTNVLKNLQKEPPVVNPPVKMEPRPAADIMAMLNKIQQNTLEKNKAASESKPETFLKNLLLGNIPAPAESKQPPLLNVTTSETKRRTLLPDPQPILAIVKKEPIIAPKDPRLRNRDPRTVAGTISNSVSLPKTNIEQNVSKVISSVTTQEHVTSTFSTTVTTVVPESAKDIKPYKLHGIYTKPPNYIPYINASQSNPSLLKDPRLRRHMNLNQKKENGSEISKDADPVKTVPAKNAPPIPKLLLKFDKSDSLNINIFESNSTTPKPVIENIQDSKTTRPKLTDPRMRKRESQANLGSNTPPHLTLESAPLKLKTEPLEDEMKPYEKKWSPPVLEKSWTPPVVDQKWTIKQEIKQEVDSDTEDPLRLQIDEGPQNPPIDADVNDSSSTAVTKKVKPTPASHLPRAIADPRMAKLHSPLDSRRPRITVPESSNKNAAELKKLNHNVSSLSDNSSDASLTFSSDTAVVESESLKTAKNIPKKHSSSEKNEEKKKTVHRNRKSSMDYASPLNSCDDNNKNLSYNSYNQRPPRTGVSKSVSDSPVSNTASSLAITDLTPDFLSDNSLECDNNIDVNLKDRFKTIDPTASPFC